MNTPVATSKKTLAATVLAAMAAAGFASNTLSAQTDGYWNVNGNGNWGDAVNWLDGDMADGAGFLADFTEVNLTNANARTVTINTTPREIGTFRIGDTDGTHGYVIAASGGGSLTFNNNGLGAQLTQVATSAANTFNNTVAVNLADNLSLSNNSAAALSLAGTITSSTTGAKNITNNGTGAGTVTLSGVIGDGSAGTIGIIQNSAASQLTLSGNNTFTGGVAIKSGTLLASNNTAGTPATNNALGTGTVLLGDTSGSADATLLLGSNNIANNIVVQTGSAGKLTITANGAAAARPTGAITLNNDLTLSVTSSQSGRNSGAFLATTGAISGSGDLNLDVSGGLSTSNNAGQPQMDSLAVGGSISTTGAINNAGSGEGRAIITGNITAAASVNQDSATSMLTLSGSNAYLGATNVNAGILRITTVAALPANNTVNVASGATFQLGNSSGTAFGSGSTLNISGDGGVASHGAIETTNNSNYAGAVVLQNDATVASGLANSALTLSGTITGSGRTLTTTGAGNHTISGVIGTGSGGLVKEGAGTTTLSGANTFTGLTRINAGALALGHASALGGGGDITFGGGALRHGSSNLADYASRIVNSTGPVAIDSNGQNVTYSGINATNTGGLLKLGSGRLTLSGVNSFAGAIAVNGGNIAVSEISAIPVAGSGSIFIDAGGALNSGGAYANVQAWLDSDNISSTSTGAIALAAGSAENIDFTGYSGLSLGASANVTHTGTITTADSTYRLGGGGATLTLSGTNALAGANALVVNGAVTLTNANDLSGATTISSGALTLGGSAGGIANSAITAGPGSILGITTATSGSPITRAASLRLNNAAFTVTGNTTANSSDIITGDLAVGSGGNSIITLSANANRNLRLSAGGFARETGGTALIRGSDLGVSTLASPVNGDSNISFASAPTLVGGSGANTTDGGILIGVVGDTSSAGIGFAATGGLLTYDATRGLRLLGASEYKTSITDGQTQLDNVKLSSASGAAATSLATGTTVNSLSLFTSATGASVAVNGAGKLTLNSGVLYSGSSASTTANTVSNTLDFNGREAMIFAGGTNNLTLSGALTNTDGNGLTVYASSGRTVTLSGADANTYTGVANVNGGTLILGKTTGVNAITGNLVVNSGAAVTQNTANQIADSANVTVNGGTFSYASDTINNIAVTGAGSVRNNAGGATLVVNGTLSVSNDANFSTAANTATSFTVAGATNLSSGGSLTLGRSQNPNGAYDSVATLNGGLNITHRSSGDYTAITIGHGSGMGQSGAKLVLGGDVTFTGNATNTHTVLIDAPRGTGRQGVIELTSVTGSRIFNIGDGAAATDLRITAALLDGAGGASGLVKTGLGTLQLSGANTYTGATTINAGTLSLGASNRIGNVSSLVMNGGTFATGGFSDTLGTLAVNGNAVFDFGSGVSALAFADSSAISWGNSVTLSILNFTEGLDTIRFGTTSESLTIAQLGKITINGLAAAINEQGYLSASAIPEPSTFAAFAGAGGLLLAGLRRRRHSV